MMTLDEMLTVVDYLPVDELAQLKEKIAEREAKPTTPEEWRQKITEALDKFWGDSTREEMEDLMEAIRTKNSSSSKGL